jgi:hypothetical protein
LKDGDAKPAESVTVTEIWFGVDGFVVSVLVTDVAPLAVVRAFLALTLALPDVVGELGEVFV